MMCENGVKFQSDAYKQKCTGTQAPCSFVLPVQRSHKIKEMHSLKA